MKKSRLYALLAMAGMFSTYMTHEEQSRKTALDFGDNPEKEFEPPKEFHLEPGIAKMIEDYREIMAGTSKKGKQKRDRIVHKVQAMLDARLILPEHVMSVELHTIEEMEDGLFHIYDESGGAVETDFETYQQAEQYANDNNLIIK